jgi:hypothetical protein
MCIFCTPELFSSTRVYRIKDGDRETEGGDYVVVLRRESDHKPQPDNRYGVGIVLTWHERFFLYGRTTRPAIVFFQARTHRSLFSRVHLCMSLHIWFSLRPHLSEMCMTDEGLCCMSTADDSATCSPHVLFLVRTIYLPRHVRWSARSRITNTTWCCGCANVVINKKLPGVLRTTE